MQGFDLLLTSVTYVCHRFCSRRVRQKYALLPGSNLLSLLRRHTSDWEALPTSRPSCFPVHTGVCPRHLLCP